MNNKKLIKIENENKFYFMNELNLNSIREDIRINIDDYKNIENDIKKLTELRNRNVILYKGFKYNEKRSVCSIYMECFKNENLHDVITRRIRDHNDFTNEEICTYISEICNGLKYIHNKKIIHKKISTSNIYIGDENQLIVGDIGISYKTDYTGKYVISLPSYRAPELWLYLPTPYTESSDIFAFGCVLYEIYTLNKLYDGESDEIIKNKIMDSSFQIEFKRIDKKRIPEIEELIVKMIDKNYLNRISLNDVDEVRKLCEISILFYIYRYKCNR